MGLLDTINTSDGRQNNKNYVPSGNHLLDVKSLEIKEGTNKNVGKKWVIIQLIYKETSRTDLPACAPGMPASIFIECNQYPDWAGQRIKNFMLATATEEELAGFARANLQPHHVQQSTPQAPNPYEGMEHGITWGEYFNLLADPAVNGAGGCTVQCMATDGKSKKGGDVTNYDFRRKEDGYTEIIAAPAPARPAATAQPQNTPAATTPAAEQPAATAKGRIF